MTARAGPVSVGDGGKRRKRSKRRTSAYTTTGRREQLVNEMAQGGIGFGDREDEWYNKGPNPPQSDGDGRAYEWRREAAQEGGQCFIQPAALKASARKADDCY
jgi:hypothetical protein